MTHRTSREAHREAAEAEWVDEHGRAIADHDRGLLYDLGT
jgi:hypothetical protein